MAKTKIGKIPVYKGEYDNNTRYDRLNQVTYLGTTFQSIVDDNLGHPPAEKSEDGGEILYINTNYWDIVAKGIDNVEERTATDNNMGYKILKKNKSFIKQVTEENTIYEIRYDFILDKNITIPAGCVLKFDGGSISGGSQQRTITCNATTIQAVPLHIFDNIVLAGTVTADLCLNNFLHSRDCVTSAGNVGRAIHVVGRCIIDEPMSVTTGFNIYGDDMYKTRIVLDSSYSGTIKSIFIFDPSTKAVNYTSFKNFGVSAIDYVFYRKQTTTTRGSVQIADFHNLYFDSIVKSTFHIECYGVGCVSIKNCYFIGNTTTKPHFYFYGYWFNNNTFEACRVSGNCGGFLKATTILDNNGEMNQNSFINNWFELITLTSDAAALIDMNSQYNFHVLNIERNYFERIYKSDNSTLATLFQLTANSAIVRNVSLKSNLAVGSFENLILYNSGAIGLEISGNGPNTAQHTITSPSLLNVTEINNGFDITYNSSNISVNKVNNIPALTKFADKLNHQYYANDIINTGKYKDYNIIPSDLRGKSIWWSDVQIEVNQDYLITGKVSYNGGNYYWVKTFSNISDVTVTKLDNAGNIRITNNTSSGCEIRLASIAMTM